jgi:hypothetical protein
MTAATSILIPSPRRELAFRMSGGLEIALYWDAEADSVRVAVYQPATEETIVLRATLDTAQVASAA